MEKQTFPKIFALFSAGILLFATMLPKISTATEDAGGTKVSCPEGDTYKCLEDSQLGIVFYKGKGSVIVETSSLD